MEKFYSNTAFATLFNSFRSLKSGAMNPDLSWRIIIANTLLVLTALAILASFSYQWATTLEEPVVIQKVDRNTVSSEEIHRVIDLYREKQKRYEELLVTQPIAPALGGDRGIDPKIVDTVQAEVLNVGNESLPPGVTPI